MYLLGFIFSVVAPFSLTLVKTKYRHYFRLSQEQEQEEDDPHQKNNNNGRNYAVYNFESYEMCELKWKTTSPKMEDDLTKNGRRLHLKWKTISSKMEDYLTKK